MNKTVLNIRKRLPTLQQIAPVFSVIVLFIYTWTTIRYLWRVPSWLYYLPLGKILTIYAYSLTVNLIESLLILLAPITLCIFLPEKWFYNRFVSRSVAIVLLGLSYVIYLNYQMQDMDAFPRPLLNWIPLVAAVIFVSAYLIDQVKFLRKLIEEFAERATVFLYIVIPVSIVSVFVVAVRNLF